MIKVTDDESLGVGASEGSEAGGAVISRTGVEAWRLSPPTARATGVIKIGSGACTEEEEGAAPPWAEAVPGG